MLKNLTKKAKVLSVVCASALLTSNAFSAITYDQTTGIVMFGDRGAGGGVASRLEGIRDGGHAGSRRQLRDHLLDRKL